MTRWILLRHGQSTANADGVFAGHLDVPLTLRGYHEALSAGRALRHERIVRVVSSDLQRASETAAAAMAGRAWAVRTTPLLRERDVGAWTGRPVPHVLAEAGGRAVMDGLSARPPGGETLAEVAHRALTFLARVDDGQPTLVVSHGGLMRAVLALVHRDLGPAEVGTRFVPNARPYVLDLPTGTWQDLLEHRATWERP